MQATQANEQNYITVHKWSEFAKPSNYLEGIKLSINFIVDKEIIVLATRISPSHKNVGKEYLTLQYTMPNSDDPDQLYVTFTGSEVLRRLIDESEPQYPFSTIIKKIHNYYMFT